MASELSQITGSIRSALGETAGTFRKASNDNNAVVGKIVKDLTRVFAQQKAQISSLNDNMEEIAHHSQQTSNKIDKLANAIADSIALQSQMASSMRSMVDGIYSSNKLLSTIQTSVYGSGGDNTLIGKISSLVTKIQFWASMVSGAVAVGAGGKIAYDQLTGGGGGGAGGGGGEGAHTPIKSSGSLAQHQQEAYSAARSELSDSGAKILVANLSGESLRNPGDVHADPSRSNPNQKAHGIASWSDVRSQKIKDQFGKYPQQMSVEEQTKALMWEMKKDYPKAWEALKNDKLSDQERLWAVVKHFENPARPEADTQTRMRYLAGLNIKDATPVSKNETQTPSTPSVAATTPSSSAGKTETETDAKHDSHGHGIVSGAASQVEKESKGKDAEQVKSGVGANLPSGDVVALGHALEKRGFRISEHPAFGGVKGATPDKPWGVHSRTGGHGDGTAIDVNIGTGNIEANNPEMAARFDKLASELRASGYKVIWRAPGHENHLHAQMVKGGSTGAGESTGTTPAAAGGGTTPYGGGGGGGMTGGGGGMTGGAEAAPAASPLESAHFSTLTGGVSYGQLSGMITALMGGASMESLAGAAPATAAETTPSAPTGPTGPVPQTSALGGLSSLLGTFGAGTGLLTNLLGPLLGQGISTEQTSAPTGEIIQSLSQQSSELNKQAAVKEAQNQISTEIATQTATEKAIEDDNMRNINRNEGRPSPQHDYNPPGDKHLTGEWMQPLRTSWYDQFMGSMIKGA